MKTGNDDPWQPMRRADPARIRELGALLRLRRVALGFRYMPPFLRDRRINIRMVGDIEHGRRDTFTYPSLTDAAAAYEVTYDSMLAVVWSGAGELVPAPPAAPAGLPPSGEWLPPTDNPAEEAAVRPYFKPVSKRLRELAAEGIAEPSGAQMFGEGTIDAYTWDSDDGRALKDLDDRAWLIAELRRNADRRNGSSGTGTASA